MLSETASPVRDPDLGSAPLMTKRAWWLIGLNLLIPGSVQLLAGNRRLGRFGVAMTFVLWVSLLLLVICYLVWPTGIYTLVSSPAGLWAITAVLVFYAVLWITLTLDTLRLARLVRTAPAARGWIAAIAVLLMVGLSGTAAYGAFVASTARGALAEVFAQAPPEPPVDGRYNILLLGADAGPDRDGLRPDSISVVSIDASTGAATIIGLPRNMLDVPFSPGSPMAAKYPAGYGSSGCEVDVCLLNSIYTEAQLVAPELYPNAVAAGSQPGIEAMRDAAQGITGLTVQYYALIDMQGFLDLVDSLGGVTIDIPTAVPIHSDDVTWTVAEWMGPGVTHLDGYHALWYARSRHDTSDYDRMARQRQLEEAVLQQFTPANVLSKFQGIAQAGTRVVKTDIPQSTLGYFVELASKAKQLPITTVELVPDNGVDPDNPDYPYILGLVQAAVAPTPAPTNG